MNKKAQGRRPVVGICVTGYNWDYETRIVEGARQRCYELGIDVLFFNPLVKRPDRDSWLVLPESIIRGENEIYKLINYKFIDGLIVEGDSFLRRDTLEEINREAEKAGVPVVNVSDTEGRSQYNVALSDATAMENVVDHLIDVHGLRRIAFIGGFKDNNQQTEERLAAYRSSLKTHGIEFDESLVEYGNFWKPAYECTERLLALPEPPQAIACANDTMAFFCIDCIKDHGLRVPEDIIVTGFDGTVESQTHTPSLTTVKHSYIESGRRAVDILNDVWNGKKVASDITVGSEVILGQSCGCVPPRNNTDTFQEFMEYKTKILEFNNYLIEMNTSFASAHNSEELFKDCKRGADYFGMEELGICICDHIENEVGNISSGEDYNGISASMKIMYDYRDRFPKGTHFMTEELLPHRLLNGEEPAFITLTPLHFKNNFLGYMIYRRKSAEISGDLLTNWVMAISNNAGSFYMRNQLEYVVRKLEDLYVRDPMTSLYNRRGMMRFGSELIERALKKRLNITVFSVDIDNLKPINDNFGHLGGDNAICQAGLALSHALPEESVVARTGGDEFCAICAGLEEGSEQRYLDRIDKTLSEYDKRSGMPYTIGVSGGFCTVPASRFDSLDSMMKLADIEMYKVKLAKKTVRE